MGILPSRDKKKISKICKRDGRIVDFDQNKITEAIFKALEATESGDRKLASKLSDKVMDKLGKKFHERTIPAVEEIQDLVEEVLVEERLTATVRAYILYREQHKQIREYQAFVDSDKVMQDYLTQTDWMVKENANMTFSLQGLNNHVASEVSRHYWLNKIYSAEVRGAHLSGDLHIHDLYMLAAYCTGWDLKDLLFRGFGGVSGKVQCKPAKHLRSALGQLVNFFYTLQGEIAGAVAFSNFDTYLAPFIRYDELDYEQVKQAMQEFLFNMNVPTRVGFQTPFTNLTLDLKVPKIIKDDPVIIGGKPQEATFGEFQAEVDILNKAFAEVMMAGDASGRVFTFPIPTYNITKDFDWGSEVANKIFEMTAKYGTPYFSNFINSDMDPDDARSMCPLAGEEKVLIKSSRGRGLEYSTIRNIYEGNSKRNEYEIYSDGGFVKGRFSRFLNQKMLKVVLENGHELKMSEEHLNFVMKGMSEEQCVLKGKDLELGMYLPYSLNKYQGEGGNSDLGYFVGAFAGDGSLDGAGTVVFSLEGRYKKELVGRLERIAKEYFGAHSAVKDYQRSKLVSLKVHSRAAVGLCRDFVSGIKRGKHYRARLFTTNVEFRKNVLAGHYATDGGNRNRIYTSSTKMIETLNMLAATLGTTTSIYKDDRPNRLGSEPNYAVLIYQLNRKRYGKAWFKNSKKLWVRIKSIESIVNSTAYCFEVRNGEPIFTVGTTGILTHNCRLRLDNRELRKRGGGLFGANPLTGSVGVVTLNMARLGYLSKTKEEYYERLEKLMRLARQSLEVKRKVLDKFTDEGLYPYCRVYLEGVKKRFGTYWKNHFNTIGINGMNESMLNFMGKNLADPEANKFAGEILDFMREKLMDYQIETNDLYNLESTPAEGTSYRFARIDKRKYPDIMVANEEAVRTRRADPFYTNSTHLPVDSTDDIFEALDFQDDLQVKYTGGTVFHGYIGEKLPDPVSTGSLVRKIAENYHLPYYTITPTFSICSEHGYLVGEHFHCPRCGQEAEVYSRVSGYLRPVQQWNKGKRSEFETRKEYRVSGACEVETVDVKNRAKIEKPVIE